MTKIELTDEEALLFLQFQKNYEVIGYILGYMDSLKTYDLRNMSITMDIDNTGTIRHCSFTKHFRQ